MTSTNSHPTATGNLLIRGATVVSVDPAIGVLDRGDILVRDDTIVAVGPDLGGRAAEDATVLDATGTIAVPGFVDSHLHAWEGQLRGVAPTADFAGYLGLTAFVYGPRYRPQDNYAGTLLTALTALNAGITTVVDNAHNALTPDHSAASIEALRDAGIRGVHAVGSPFGAALDHVPGTALSMQECYAGPLLNVRLFEVDPTPELWRFAAAHDLWVSTELGPHTPGLDDRIEALHAAGLFTARHTLNHCYDLSPRLWQLIADSGAAVNLCPRSDATFGLGSTVPPVTAALKHAAAVGLSNDNEVSYGIDMFAEMRTLALRHRSEAFRGRADRDDLDLLTPARLLEMATLGGAHNAGLADTTGSLTPGKQADIVLVRADAIETWPGTDPTTTIASFAHPGTVDTVLVAGQVRKRAGRLVDLDTVAVRELVRASMDFLHVKATPAAHAMA